MVNKCGQAQCRVSNNIFKGWHGSTSFIEKYQSFKWKTCVPLKIQGKSIEKSFKEAKRAKDLLFVLIDNGAKEMQCKVHKEKY